MKLSTLLLLSLLLLYFPKVYSQNFSVTLDADPPGAASLLEGAGTYAAGTEVEVSAPSVYSPNPDETWIFSHWSEDGEIVSEGPVYVFGITSDRQLLAQYSEHIPELLVDPGMLDFGLVPLGHCEDLSYTLSTPWLLEKTYEDIELVAPDGFQIQFYDHPFSDTLYFRFYLGMGFPVFVRFCPTEDRPYSDFIFHNYPGTDPVRVEVKGQGFSRQLNLRLVLEGAFNGEETLMHTLLNDQGLLPLSQPFDPALPWHGNPAPLWHYTGHEMAGLIPEEAVDWVLLELRHATSARWAFRNRTTMRFPGLLLNDGSIISLQGMLPAVNQAPLGNLLAVVYHRNHLPVISPEIIPLQGENYNWDFTTAAKQAHERGLKQLDENTWGLYGGDSDGDGIIGPPDLGVWNTLAGQNGYQAADLQMNGQVQTQDKNNIWYYNQGISTHVPLMMAIGPDGQPCEDMPQLQDPRDENTYTTIYIGGQCWMAENLRYLPQVSAPPLQSETEAMHYVYGYEGQSVGEASATASYQQYGVLYNWPAAREACPPGWRLPTHKEWLELEEYLMQTYELSAEREAVNAVGNSLKSCRQLNSPYLGCPTPVHPRWAGFPPSADESVHFGTDDFGFAALPGGRYLGQMFAGRGLDGHWWTSTISETAGQPWAHSMHSYQGNISRQWFQAQAGLSLRCISENE